MNLGTAAGQEDLRGSPNNPGRKNGTKSLKLLERGNEFDLSRSSQNDYGPDDLNYRQKFLIDGSASKSENDATEDLPN